MRNTYKVLLTRGMLGSLLHSTDAETQELLKGLLDASPAGARRGALTGYSGTTGPWSPTCLPSAADARVTARPRTPLGDSHHSP